MCKNAKNLTKYGVIAWIALASLFVLACSDGRTSLGNSAESGNPEIAGTIRFEDGSLAAYARVAVVPASFSAVGGDELDSVFVGVSDSLGHYSFDSVPEGGFSLEAMDESTGRQFLKLGLFATPDTTTLDVDAVLEDLGGVRLGAHGFEDGTTGYVYVPGTTILRPVTVKMGNIFVDSLPADSLYPFVFISDDGYALSLPSTVKHGGSQMIDSLSETIV